MPTGRFSPNIFPGARFGRLTVVKRIPRDGKRRSSILCECDCGKEVRIECSNLNNGNSKSCGCLNKDKIKQRNRDKSINSKGYGKVIPGATFGRLTVVRRIEKNGNLTNRVKCICECGHKTKSNIDGLIYGLSKSCGCLHREITAKRNKDAAKFKCFSSRYPKTYISWHCMIARCYNNNSTGYESYGGAGVIVCEYLRQDPNNLKAVIGLRKKTRPSLDRYPIHNGNYACGKCNECKRNGWELNIRWATRKEQSLNRGSFNVYLTAFGKTMTKSQWSEVTGLSWSRITQRLRSGWSVERTLSTPDKNGNCYKEA